MRLRNRSHGEDLESNSQESTSPSKRSRGHDSTDETTQKTLFIVFEDSPVQSLVNTKVPIDFEGSGTVSVGRDPTNNIVIPDSDVSRHHAEFSMVGTRVMLKDLQSTNGTYVHDGKKFQQVNGSAPVKLKTRIRFGTSTIVQLTRETETQYEH